MKDLKRKINNLFRPKRLSLTDPIRRKEDWNVRISAAGLIGGVAAFCLFMFLLVLLLVAYTPVLDIFPGYRTSAERSHDELVQNIMRIDSLERRMNDMLTYNENIAMIMEGRTPVLRTPMNDDTTRLDKTLVPPSQLDSLLRAQMEGEATTRCRVRCASASAAAACPSSRRPWRASSRAISRARTTTSAWAFRRRPTLP